MSIELLKLEPKLMLGAKPALEPTDGTFIAGGAVRQWFVGTEASSDIDVFGVSGEALDNFIKIRLPGAKPLVSREDLRSFSFNGQLVQVISYDYYPDMAGLLDSFDFTVCQFGWDGKDIFGTSLGLISVLRGHLGVHKIDKALSTDSLRRAFKYAAKGYKPCHATIRDLGLSFNGLAKEEIENQIQISPNGGTRIIGVD